MGDKLYRSGECSRNEKIRPSFSFTPSLAGLTNCEFTQHTQTDWEHPFTAMICMEMLAIDSIYMQLKSL